MIEKLTNCLAQKSNSSSYSVYWCHYDQWCNYALLPHANPQSPDLTEYNRSRWQWHECFYEPVSLIHLRYTTLVGKIAGSVKELQLIVGKNASLKSMTYRQAHNFWHHILISSKSMHLTFKNYPFYIGEYKVPSKVVFFF